MWLIQSGTDLTLIQKLEIKNLQVKGYTTKFLPPLLQRETTFKISYLLPWVRKPFQKGINSARNKQSLTFKSWPTAPPTSPRPHHWGGRKNEMAGICSPKSVLIHLKNKDCRWKKYIQVKEIHLFKPKIFKRTHLVKPLYVNNDTI